MSNLANSPGIAAAESAALHALAIGIADDSARSDIEVYARWVELDGVTYFDTTQVPDDGLVHDAAQELALVWRAVRYIDMRGDALPFRMQRHISAPQLVCFDDTRTPA